MIVYSVNIKHSFQAFLNQQLHVLFTMHLFVILGQMFKINNVIFVKNCHICGKGIDPYKSMHTFLLVMFNYIYYIILGYLKNVANICFQSRFFLRYGSICVSGNFTLTSVESNQQSVLNLILDSQPRTQRPLAFCWSTLRKSLRT